MTAFAAHVADLRLTLLALAPLTDSEWQAFAPALRPLKLAPGESFARRGDTEQLIGYIGRGLLKVYYLTRRGGEFIRTFCAERSFAGDLASTYIGPGVPTAVEIVALEPSDLVVFPYAAFASRLANSWTWQQVGRRMAEEAYLLRERRQYELMTMSSAERFTAFFAHHEALASRISQKDLAAYLAMTPTSLSRMRARVKRKKPTTSRR